MVTVRYFAAARAAAGVGSEVVAAGSLPELVAELVARHGAGVAAVLTVASLVTEDGVRLAPDASLEGVDVVEVLPPFAGG